MAIDLMCGDCLELMWKVPSGSVDAIICDLPYGTTQNAWDIIVPFEPLWAQYKRIIKKNGVVILFASQPFTSLLVCSNLKWFKHEWVWEKNRGSNFGNTVREPMKEHESVLVFSRGQWTFNRQMQKRTGGGLGLIGKMVPCRTTSNNYGQFAGFDSELPELRVPSSWQKFNTEVGLHPNQKPVPLLDYLVRTYTNEGETVMDNCMGSASTGVACVRTNRNFIGIEKESSYFEIARKRLEEEQGKIESTLFYQAEKTTPPRPVQPTLFAG